MIAKLEKHIRDLCWFPLGVYVAGFCGEPEPPRDQGHIFGRGFGKYATFVSRKVGVAPQVAFDKAQLLGASAQGAYLLPVCAIVRAVLPFYWLAVSRGAFLPRTITKTIKYIWNRFGKLGRIPFVELRDEASGYGRWIDGEFC